MIILYAEDDVDDFSAFIDVVKSINPEIECINASNGAEALEILENAPVLPEYVFLDINMPAMDGKACLKAMKNDARLKDIPVVIYTTSMNPRDVEHCQQLGAARYINKPTSMAAARVELEKVFG